MGGYTSFYDTDIWKKSLEISKCIFKISCNLPRCEDYGLTSQIRRASNSISANIAEGYGRLHKKDKINFYIIARGSATETISHLLYGKEINYFTHEVTHELIKKLEIVILEINKIMKSVSRAYE